MTHNKSIVIKRSVYAIRGYILSKLVHCAVALLVVSCSSMGNIDNLSLSGDFIQITGTPLPSGNFSADNIAVEKTDGRLLIRAGSVKIDYNLSAGTADVYRAGTDAPVISGFFAETEIDGRKLSSDGFQRSGGFVFLDEINDAFGTGVRVSVKNEGGGYTLWQNFYAYRTKSYVLLETVVESSAGVLTNYIAPIAAGTGGTDRVLNIGSAEDPRFLFVPFDNWDYARYRADKLMGAGESCEVTAVFDNASRRAVVIGSISHDAWKTGIRVKPGIGRGGDVPIIDLRVFGGLASGTTRDTEPHGSLYDYQVYSPKIFLGFFEDWRDGMEEYGRANGIAAPPLAWDQGPPFGWNSWAAVGTKINYDVYKTASDFLRKEMPGFTNNQGVVYINFDGWWNTTMDEAQIREAAAAVKRNGQRPGIYHVPYMYRSDFEQSRNSRPSECPQYTYYDLILKDKKGRPVSTFYGTNWGCVLDPTHPGTVMINNARMNQFKEWGFEYVKLDFLSHGAVEGVHAVKSIRTGIQAYNYGMKKILEALGDSIPNQKFFVSLSIAPIFPANIAHARRISCDAFETIADSEYVLNSVTYGWWLNRSVYPYNDPDHTPVYGSYRRDNPSLFNEGLTRYIASAIAGTVMLAGDDYRIPEARERAKKIYLNDEVNKLAADGISFRPVEGSSGSRAAEIFIRHDKDAGVLYCAVFNFDKDKARTMTLDLKRLGLDSSRTWRVRNLISHQEEAPVSTGSMVINLAGAESRIYKLYQ